MGVALALLLTAAVAFAQLPNPETLIAQFKADSRLTYLDTVTGPDGSKVTYFYRNASAQQRPDGVMAVNVFALNDRIKTGGPKNHAYVGLLIAHYVRCAEGEYKAPLSRLLTGSKEYEEVLETEAEFQSTDHYAPLREAPAVAQRVAKLLCAGAPAAGGAKVPATLASRSDVLAALDRAIVGERADSARCELRAFRASAYPASVARWYDLSDAAAERAVTLTAALCAKVFAPDVQLEQYRAKVRAGLTDAAGSERDAAGQRTYFVDVLPVLEQAKAEVAQAQQDKQAKVAADRAVRAEREQKLRSGAVAAASIDDAAIAQAAQSATALIMFPAVGPGEQSYVQKGLLVAGEGNVLLGNIGPRGYAVFISDKTKFFGSRSALRVGLPFGFVGRYLGAKTTEAGTLATFAADYVGLP